MVLRQESPSVPPPPPTEAPFPTRAAGEILLVAAAPTSPHGTRRGTGAGLRWDRPPFHCLAPPIKTALITQMTPPAPPRPSLGGGALPVSSPLGRLSEGRDFTRQRGPDIFSQILFLSFLLIGDTERLTCSRTFQRLAPHRNSGEPLGTPPSSSCAAVFPCIGERNEPITSSFAVTNLSHTAPIPERATPPANNQPSPVHSIGSA